MPQGFDERNEFGQLLKKGKKGEEVWEEGLLQSEPNTRERRVGELRQLRGHHEDDELVVYTSLSHYIPLEVIRKETRKAEAVSMQQQQKKRKRRSLLKIQDEKVAQEEEAFLLEVVSSKLVVAVVVLWWLGRKTE